MKKGTWLKITNEDRQEWDQLLEKGKLAIITSLQDKQHTKMEEHPNNTPEVGN